MAPKDITSETPGAKPLVVETPPGPPAPHAAQAPAAAAVVVAETKTAAEWAAQLGHIKPRDSRFPQSTDHVDPKYAVADQLYGWSERAYHHQAPEDAFRITVNTYLDALRTAQQFPATELTVDALTPAAAARLEGFKPARNLKVERAAAAAAESKAAAEKAKASAESTKEQV